MLTTELRLDEANELLAAWVSARAESLGIRALLIKGRQLGDDGLRAPRVSSDVDLLVDPAGVDRVCDALQAANWEEFPSTFASAHFTLHSRTFRKAGWPNSLDVHSEYPGFLAEPEATFDALWAARRSSEFAHRACPVPSRVAGALMLALHSLRGTHAQPRHRDELSALAHAEFTDAERAELARLADATGASLPLRAVLADWGVQVEVTGALADSARGREWHRKTAEAEGSAASWLLLLRSTAWRDKPEVVFRAIWPSRKDFLKAHPEIADRTGPLIRGRISRWGRGFRRLPAALRALARP